jgi:chorismate dehydratase
MLSEQSDVGIRLGAVSFLNTKPLIEGVEREPGVSVRFAVPSALAALVRAGEVDASLMPIVDLAREGGAWRRVSDACIGSDGETMTVRVFSRVPPERMTVLYGDPDSHTSVALAKVLWAKRWGRRLELRPLPPPEQLADCESVLLIGDKVVRATVAHFEHQTDLGGAWKAWTGLPFVFAVWGMPCAAGTAERGRHGAETIATNDGRYGRLERLLCAARDRGVVRAAELAAEYGPKLGWPVDLAIEYLTRRLMFTISPRALEGARKFLGLAAEMDLIPEAGARVV